MSAHDKALLARSDAQLMEAADLTDAEFDELENQLALRASCMGWTGDPMPAARNCGRHRARYHLQALIERLW